MRLYKITASSPSDDGTPFERVHYVGSKSEGVAYRKGLADQGFKRKEITEVEVDIPTNKEGLLAWLNGGAV